MKVVCTLRSQSLQVVVIDNPQLYFCYVRVGGSRGDCTVNLINRGIVVTDDMVTIQFARNGDASSHTCRIDRQQSRQCKPVNSGFCYILSVCPKPK